MDVRAEGGGRGEDGLGEDYWVVAGGGFYLEGYGVLGDGGAHFGGVVEGAGGAGSDMAVGYGGREGGAWAEGGRKRNKGGRHCGSQSFCGERRAMKITQDGVEVRAQLCTVGIIGNVCTSVSYTCGTENTGA